MRGNMWRNCCEGFKISLVFTSEDKGLWFYNYFKSLTFYMAKVIFND
jgi:hypothetical protein